MMFQLDEDLEPDSGFVTSTLHMNENPFRWVSSPRGSRQFVSRFNSSPSSDSLNRLMLDAAEEPFADSPTAVQVRRERVADVARRKQ